MGRHVPESFPLGTPPSTLKVTGPALSLRSTNDLATKTVLRVCKDGAQVGLMWSVTMKETEKKVTATGAVLYLKKQTIIPANDEVRLV